MLQPGESRTFEFEIPDGLVPGEYQVQFTYYASKKALLAGAKEDLVSDKVRFVVAK